MQLQVTRFASILVLATACVLGGCNKGLDLASTRGYVLISIDTLRADHLGCYGYRRPTSPFIDSLAAQGLLFENAFAQFPGTLPSHMSMFTGLYPSEHSVFPPDGVLAPDISTISESFKRSNFKTSGHSEGGFVHGGYGFERGFDEWNHDAKKIESDVERTFHRGLEFLRQIGDDDRFFLFLHTYAVHDPYFPTPRYDQTFWDGPPPESFSPTGPNLIAFNRGELELSVEALEFFKSRYDSAIRYTDEVLEEFFEGLTGLGLLGDTTVILTSDHGEEFLEHGRLSHSQVYPETVRVPLLLIHPSLDSAMRVQSPVQLIDIAPTLAELADLKGPRMSGKSLLAGLPEMRHRVGGEAYSESSRQKQRALFRLDRQGFHQILHRGSGSQDRGQHWVERSSELDIFPGRTNLELRSFYKTREVSIQVEGEHYQSVDVTADSWTSVGIRIGPEEGISRVRLTAIDCQSPVSVGINSDPRCLSFAIRGRYPATLELYDIDDDPLANSDRSRSIPERLRLLNKRLVSYSHKPVSTTPKAELDAELAARLRALGYLD